MRTTDKPIWLADASQGRDNNLNLIRMVAACAVLVSHAWPIALGKGTEEPLQALVGESLGTIAVFVFFAISGFLIAQSFERAPTLRRWCVARALRLFPALFVVLVLTVALLGPAFTSLPLAVYATEPATATYVPRNLSLAVLQYPLPGVFLDNPYPKAINGSLWTLFYEAAWYGMVLVLGLLGALRAGARYGAFLAAFVALYVWLIVLGDPRHLDVRVAHFLRLGLPFAIGTACYVWRASIPLTAPLVGALALVAYAAIWTPLAPIGIAGFVAYATFFLAYRIGGFVRGYNALGDYSYGMYIFAFPTQQIVAALTGGGSPAMNVALSLPPTLFCAVLSWRFVEKPALAMVSRLAPAPKGAAQVRRYGAARAERADARLRSDLR